MNICIGHHPAKAGTQKIVVSQWIPPPYCLPGQAYEARKDKSEATHKLGSKCIVL